jgi:hypothetical protein
MIIETILGITTVSAAGYAVWKYLLNEEEIVKIVDKYDESYDSDDMVVFDEGHFTDTDFNKIYDEMDNMLSCNIPELENKEKLVHLTKDRPIRKTRLPSRYI